MSAVKKNQSAPDNDAKIAELREKIKKGESSGIYYFYGEEVYLCDYYINQLSAVSGGEIVRFTTEDFNFSSFLEEVGTLTFDGSMRFIEVRDADLAKLRDSEKKQMMEIVQAPADFCLVFNYCRTKAEKTSRGIIADIRGVVNAIEFEKQTKAKLINWLGRIFSSSSIASDNAVLLYIIECTNGDMNTLFNEAQKLIGYKLSQSGDRILIKADVDLIVSKSIEVEAFELSNCILEGRYSNALSALEKIKRSGGDDKGLIASISRVFCDLKLVGMAKTECGTYEKVAKELKMHEYKVKLYISALNFSRNSAEFVNRAISVCAEADIRSKSTQTDSFTLAQDLIFHLWKTRIEFDGEER